MNRVTTLLSLVVLLASLEVSTAKVYEKCELVHELRSKGVAEKDLSDWVCLAWHESRYDTDAFGRLNWDGSVDHGLFQISDIYWCDWRSREPARHYKNVCGANCDAFHDDNIGDDLSCVMQIFKEHERLRGNGFMAWVAWKTHCQHADTSTFTAGCDRAPAPTPTPRPDRPRPPSTHKSVQQHYQEPPHTNAHTHFNNLAPLANRLVRLPAANKGRLVPYARDWAREAKNDRIVPRRLAPLPAAATHRPPPSWNRKPTSPPAAVTHRSAPSWQRRVETVPRWGQQAQSASEILYASSPSSSSSAGNSAYGSNMFLRAESQHAGGLPGQISSGPGRFSGNMFLRGLRGTQNSRRSLSPASHPYNGNMFLSNAGTGAAVTPAPNPYTVNMFLSRTSRPRTSLAEASASQPQQVLPTTPEPTAPRPVATWRPVRRPVNTWHPARPPVTRPPVNTAWQTPTTARFGAVHAWSTPLTTYKPSIFGKEVWART